ncbi:hypothetical protein CLIM01_10788 [Colletotrichum limetticola]|uniref:Uncharacterized protein n=1 Tax=Colletotrichum limetticola TaxID=1209924 RepID=A0ABQ9PIH2_9PEZI|nr:hypothetical protein CLIM01_10788 [Colletotrichum limetticola]
MGERTGSRVFQWVWSYVTGKAVEEIHDALDIGQLQDSRSAPPFPPPFGGRFFGPVDLLGRPVRVNVEHA